MKLFYITGVIFTLPIFSGFSQEFNKNFHVGKPMNEYNIKNINPFQDQSPYAQFKSFQKLNKGVIPLDREIKFFKAPVLKPREMPIARLESNDPMPIKHFDSAMEYTLLIKPSK